MEKSHLLGAVCAVLLTFIAVSANAAFINSSVVEPAKPTTSDLILIKITGELRNFNDFFTADTPSVTIVDNNIDIDIFAQSPPIVLPAIQPYELDTEIGILDAGAYSYEIDFFYRSIQEQTVSGEIRVVPLPPAILLMLSGFTLLISIGRISARKAQK